MYTRRAVQIDVLPYLCVHGDVMIILQVEKQRVGLQHELDDLSQRLDEAGGATQAQVTYTTWLAF